VSVKVRIVKPFLRPMGSDEALNRIAIVYIGQEEYRVSAPAKAEGPAIEWLDHAFVRKPDGFNSEIQVSDDLAKTIIKYVKAELEKLPAAAPAQRNAATTHAVDSIQRLCSKFHEVAKQLRVRHAGRKALDMTDEYDVQDLMHALLRIFFADVRDEEWTLAMQAAQRGWILCYRK
jgi:REase_DpnII-MboI